MAMYIFLLLHPPVILGHYPKEDQVLAAMLNRAIPLTHNRRCT